MAKRSLRFSAIKALKALSDDLGGIEEVQKLGEFGDAVAELEDKYDDDNDDGETGGDESGGDNADGE